MKVYGDIQSGNCYKIKLAMSLLDIDHKWIHVDILANETATAEFLSRNQNGKVPVLELPDGRYLSESNAILAFLADGTTLLPEERFDRAKVLQWQFFEQYSHEPYIAVARFIAKYLGLPEDRRTDYESRQAGGHKALSIMETRLTRSAFLVGASLTVADISLYAYTHVAHEGGFDLSRYPAIQNWLGRIAAHPKYLSMA